MPAAVRRPIRNLVNPILSEFVPKAYPNQKVQGGMGILIPNQFSGGYATGDHSPVLEEKPVYVAPNVYAGYEDLSQKDFVEMAKNPNSTFVDPNYDTTNVILSPEMISAVEEFNQQPKEVVPAYYNEERYNQVPINGVLSQASEVFNEAEPVLINKNEPIPPNNTGVLSTTTSQNRMSSPVSGNARGSQMPNMKISQGEMLMRMGAAGVGAANRGDSFIEAMGQTYGNIQDANRQAEINAFNAQEATRLAEERIQALRNKEKADNVDTKAVGDLKFGIAKLQNGLEMIRNAKGNLTGVNAGALFSRIYGKTVGSEAEAQRLFLKELGLDAVMKRVQQTKGAISNAEMKLFASSVPDISSQEIVWEKWIERQIQMSAILINRLENGNSVDYDAPLSETMPSIKLNNSTPTDNDDLSDDEKKYLNM